jgi:hypothetical protein
MNLKHATGCFAFVLALTAGCSSGPTTTFLTDAWITERGVLCVEVDGARWSSTATIVPETAPTPLPRGGIDGRLDRTEGRTTFRLGGEHEAPLRRR